MKKIKILHYGLGPIGIEAAKLALTKDWIELVGAVDIDKNKVGKDLGELIGIKKIGVIVTDDLNKAFEKKPDVAVHTTSSRIDAIYDQLESIILRGASIVSSTEELFYPYNLNKQTATEIDNLAKKYGVTVLGTGVNPGFVMDTLVLSLSGVCQKVDRIKVNRIVDASTRRGPLQRKIGAGISVDEFFSKVEKKELGHVGLVESLAFVGESLRLKLDEVKEDVQPVIAEHSIKTDHISAEKGKVVGINHTAIGYLNKKEIIKLTLQMYIGAKNPHDEIIIEGKPNLNLRIENGVAGDVATAAMLINAIPKVVNAEKGLLSAERLPVVHYFS